MRARNAARGVTSGLLILGVVVLVVSGIGSVVATAQTPTPAAPQVPEVIVREEPTSLWEVVSAVSTLIYGVATAVLAAAAIYGAVVSLRRYWDQRRRETSRDLARLYSDLVGLLQRRLERARGTSDESAVREDLEEIESVFEGIVHGIMISDEELSKLKREALRAYGEEERRTRNGSRGSQGESTP